MRPRQPPRPEPCRNNDKLSGRPQKLTMPARRLAWFVVWQLRTLRKGNTAQRNVSTKDAVNLIDSVTKTILKRKSKMPGNGKKTTWKRQWEAARKRYKNNPEKTKDRVVRWRKNNPEKAREACKEALQKQPRKGKGSSRAVEEKQPGKGKGSLQGGIYKNNPEKAKEACRRYYKNNVEKAKDRVVRWRKNNPEKARDISRKGNEKSRKKPMRIESK